MTLYKKIPNPAFPHNSSQPFQYLVATDDEILAEATRIKQERENERRIEQADSPIYVDKGELEAYFEETTDETTSNHD